MKWVYERYQRLTAADAHNIYVIVNKIAKMAFIRLFRLRKRPMNDAVLNIEPDSTFRHNTDWADSHRSKIRSQILRQIRDETIIGWWRKRMFSSRRAGARLFIVRIQLELLGPLLCRSAAVKTLKITLFAINVQLYTRTSLLCNGSH